MAHKRFARSSVDPGTGNWFHVEHRPHETLIYFLCRVDQNALLKKKEVEKN